MPRATYAPVGWMNCSLFSFLRDEFPPLDCHAHVSPDVTTEEVRRLGSAFVFAMTRSLSEADAVAVREDSSIVWGCGVHPGLQRALDSYDVGRLTDHLQRFALLGEIGLDRRGGRLVQQSEVLRSILRVAQGYPVLLSLHSVGRTRELVGLLAEQPHPGAILHWFLGGAALINAAIEAGCYFSVNAAMPDDVLVHIPHDRMLPETDFPFSRRRTRAQIPGDIEYLELRISQLTGLNLERVRWQWYKNLRTLSATVGVLDRLPSALADFLVSA